VQALDTDEDEHAADECNGSFLLRPSLPHAAADDDDDCDSFPLLTSVPDTANEDADSGPANGTE